MRPSSTRSSGMEVHQEAMAVASGSTDHDAAGVSLGTSGPPPLVAPSNAGWRSSPSRFKPSVGRRTCASAHAFDACSPAAHTPTRGASPWPGHW
jgi:hypothetical protein